MDSMIENGVFGIIPKKEIDYKKTIINTQWVLNRKFYVEGNLERYKARFIAQGFKPKEGVDYEETLSPTRNLSKMIFLLDYTIQLGTKPHQTDSVTTYLNPELEENKAVYISIPKGFIDRLSETKQETYSE